MDEKKKVLAFEKTILFILEKMLSKAKAKEIMEQYRAIFNPKYAVLIALVFEIVLLMYDLYKGSLTKEQFLEVVIKRICAAVCSIPSFWLAYYLGGMLSITICGYVLPAILVSIIAGAVGDFVAKEAGGKFAEVVTPLVKRLRSEVKDKIH